jgi:uncharacterized protein (TIGR03084 family)
MQQATDFCVESDALYQLIEPLKDDEFDQPTQFKGWTINQVLGHLHMWNFAADLSLKDGDQFMEFLNGLMKNVQGGGLGALESVWLKGINNRELLDTWHEYFIQMSDRFLEADPKMRLKWVGPDMSARSSITARLMETWAHSQEVYDTLGVERVNGDRIKNIVVLGVNTFGWTYVNRGLETPAEMPCLKLQSPSGETWEWGDASAQNSIEGAAVEFCQVVTQVRNIADTSLVVKGDVATQWMSIAQCFAGGPEDPPVTGSRCTR